ncbi:MAG: spore cortex biosynthesis protein YabQ [Clostridia bacterium]|nr:spore cortex biosynthesis protein YabQ [Clostridia bacterium]
MEISQLALARLWLYALCSGGLLGIVFDALQTVPLCLLCGTQRTTIARIREMHLPLLHQHDAKPRPITKNILQIGADVLFCLIGAVWSILLVYAYNNGKFRFPVLLCLALGFACYRALLSRFVRIGFEWCAFLIRTAVRYLICFLFMPIKFAYRFCKRVVLHICDRVATRRAKRARHHFTNRLTEHDERALGIHVSKKK